jgi:3'-phosphoadenosine 5'-phosphosulfate sulfotransferase (PAPS reductase)/FAD synthetase
VSSSDKAARIGGGESADRVLVWFSCGAASAVAARLAVDTYGDRCTVVYCDTMATEHPDNARFFRDVETWIGHPIQVIRSETYATIDDVFERTRFMAGIHGARCTTELKKLPRLAFQRDRDTHVFGYTWEEKDRAESFEEANPELIVEWLLIERGINKADCLAMLREAGIPLPAMYGLGFDHNNCIGCPKATSPGYWNRVRRLFPDVFARRAAQSRMLGVRLARVHDERVFLDELAPDAHAPDDDIDCGPVCQVPLFKRWERK